MAATTITLNLKKRLIRLHVQRRRVRLPGLVRESVARFAKADVNDVAIHKDLNKRLLSGSAGMGTLKVSFEKIGGTVEVKLPSTKNETQTAAPATAPKTEKKEKAGNKGKTVEPSGKNDSNGNREAPNPGK